MEAVLKCTHNPCFEQKYEKIYIKKNPMEFSILELKKISALYRNVLILRITIFSGTAAPVDQVEQCFTQSEILAAIIILGTTVCILFIACFVMSCMLVKRRGSKSSFGSLSNKKLSDRFHIPRAHVNEHINEAYTSL